jgi:ribulose-phosphate 3-epimerase
MNNTELKKEVVPAIIPKDFENLAEEIDLVADLVDWVQIDVLDKKFAPTISWPYNKKDEDKWQQIINQDEGLPRWKDVNFEVDLMVEDQMSAAEDWINAGASRLIGHIESLLDEDIEKFKSFRKEFDVEIVFSLEPSTDNSVIEPHLDDIDGVQFMGNDKIGYHGVQLDEKVLEKVRDLRAKKPNMPIGIDIGVNFDTATALAEAGVTRFSSGSLILNADNPKEAIEKLKDLI